MLDYAEGEGRPHYDARLVLKCDLTVLAEASDKYDSPVEAMQDLFNELCAKMFRRFQESDEKVRAAKESLSQPTSGGTSSARARKRARTEE